ncbi:hypothetical protein TMatcc_005784 [Talaromyces marneffei ATCC 18224]
MWSTMKLLPLIIIFFGIVASACDCVEKCSQCTNGTTHCENEPDICRHTGCADPKRYHLYCVG